MANRNLVVPLVETYFSTDGSLMKKGYVGIDHIQKDWTGGGTTCGFTPHWLWWRMGCLDANLLNRFEPDSPFKYKDGYNINRVYAHPKFTTLSAAGVKTVHDEQFVKGAIYPQTGDAVIIQGEKHKDGSESTHIFVVLDDGAWLSDTKGTWRVVETGQGSTYDAGHIASHGVEYKNGKWMVGSRWMLGWLNIDAVTFSSPRAGLDNLDDVTRQATPANVKDLIGIWKVTASSEVWYYFFYKGFRVFYSSEASKTSLAGGGYWYPSGSGYTITWDWNNSETMTLTSKTEAKGNAGGDIWTAKKVSASATTMGNYHNSLGLSV